MKHDNDRRDNDDEPKPPALSERLHSLQTANAACDCITRTLFQRGLAVFTYSGLGSTEERQMLLLVTPMERKRPAQVTMSMWQMVTAMALGLVVEE